MYLKVTLLRKDLLANMALEGFHAEVFSQVNLESRFLRIGDWAEMASVWLYIAMIHEMSL